jgi:hypothetical protein
MVFEKRSGAFLRLGILHIILLNFTVSKSRKFNSACFINWFFQIHQNLKKFVDKALLIKIKHTTDTVVTHSFATVPLTEFFLVAAWQGVVIL